MYGEKLPVIELQWSFVGQVCATSRINSSILLAEPDKSFSFLHATVKPEEAPGYAERIIFPMDLSLVRKMIVSRIITSYAEMHQKIRLISHNCVKYNGRYVHICLM